jgi:hypothetical protein
MKLEYYGVDAATKSIWYFGLDGSIYVGNYDNDTSEWQLDPGPDQLPAVVFPSTYRILDSNDDKILYAWEGKKYKADLDLKRFGNTASYLWSISNVAETNLITLPVAASAEDKMAKATSSPLIPILLIAAAYWVFIR